MNLEQLREYFIHDLKWGWGHQSKIVFSFLCEAAKEAKGGVIVDAGAGGQRYKPFFDESIYIAQEHPIAGQQNKNIQVYDILSDVKTIPIKDGSVDLVLSTSSLEHMEFPDLFFAESIRILKPGGALYINVPFAYEEHEIPYDFQRPTRYGLIRYYSHAGFERISVSPISSSIDSVQYLFTAAVRESLMRLGRAFWAKAVRAVLLYSLRFLCKVAMLLFDRGPNDDTTLPIGWVAKGYKVGAKVVGPLYQSKQDFMNVNAMCDETMVLRGGRILPK